MAKYDLINSKESVIEWLEGLDNSELVEVNNNYCNLNSYGEHMYTNCKSSINEFGWSAWDVLTKTNHDNYDIKDDYFMIDNDGDIVSFDDVASEMDFDDIAKYILNGNEHHFDISFTDEHEAYFDDLCHDWQMRILQTFFDENPDAHSEVLICNIQDKSLLCQYDLAISRYTDYEYDFAEWFEEWFENNKEQLDDYFN